MPCNVARESFPCFKPSTGKDSRATLNFTAKDCRVTYMRYKALALQITCDTVNSCQSKQEVDGVYRKTFNKINAQIRASKVFIGQDLKLVVLPEYFLTGFPMGETIEQWREKPV